MEEVKSIATNHINTLITGDPLSENTHLGPVINNKQYMSIQQHIKKGIETCELIAGGIGKPSNCHKGFFIKPTIFSNVPNNNALATEEIFGPVLSIISYKDLDEAITITNNSKYGLSSYISSKDTEMAHKLAKKIKAGQTIINKVSRGSVPAPFGGFKMSGNGREHGKFGLEEYLEVKAII